MKIPLTYKEPSILLIQFFYFYFYVSPTKSFLSVFKVTLGQTFRIRLPQVEYDKIKLIGLLRDKNNYINLFFIKAKVNYDKLKDKRFEKSAFEEMLIHCAKIDGLGKIS